MKSTFLAAGALAILVATAGAKNGAYLPGETLAVPEHGAYLGAFIDFGDTEDAVTLAGIERYEKLIEKRVAIIASSSYWGEQTFPSANLELIAHHGAVPLVFWSPWDRPYQQLKGPDKFSLDQILAGKWDSYIDRWAAGAKAFGRPFLVSLCNEMNGDWFPWSGCYYGGDKPIGAPAARASSTAGTATAAPPAKFEGPENFKRAWRYIVDRVRAHGGTNVLWVFHVNNYSDPQQKWNAVAQYYPGSAYVDWLGLSIYGKQERYQDHWMDFDEDLLEEPYADLAAVDPAKPIVVAEFGVGEFPDIGDKAKWIAHAFASMSSPQYSRIKAAVYWHERWQNTDGSYSNLRVNSSLETLQAFRDGIRGPFWVPAPIWKSPSPVAGGAASMAGP